MDPMGPDRPEPDARAAVSLGDEPTVPTPSWSPPSDRTEERPISARPPMPPPWSAPGALPPPLPPPSTGAAPRPAPSTRRAVLLGGVAGALMSAIVATGVTVALDDQGSSTVDRPAVTPVTTSQGTLDIQAILTNVQPSVVTIRTSAATSQGMFEGAGSGIVPPRTGWC